VWREECLIKKLIFKIVIFNLHNNNYNHICRISAIKDEAKIARIKKLPVDGQKLRPKYVGGSINK